MRVVFRKTGVGDSRSDYLSGSHLQSQVKSPRQMILFTYASVRGLDWSVLLCVTQLTAYFTKPDTWNAFSRKTTITQTTLNISTY